MALFPPLAGSPVIVHRQQLAPPASYLAMDMMGGMAEEGDTQHSLLFSIWFKSQLALANSSNVSVVSGRRMEVWKKLTFVNVSGVWPQKYSLSFTTMMFHFFSKAQFVSVICWSCCFYKPYTIHEDFSLRMYISMQRQTQTWSMVTIGIRNHQK